MNKTKSTSAPARRPVSLRPCLEILEVRECPSTSSIFVIAGNGSANFSPVPTITPQTATSVGLNAPLTLAVDSSGNVYIGDKNHNLIEKETPGGQLSVIAGDATPGAGSPPSSAPQLATSVALNQPRGVAVDSSGNVYIADTNNSLVEEVGGPNAGALKGMLWIIAGVGIYGGTTPTVAPQSATSVHLVGPFGLTVDSSNNVYITDFGNNVIERLTPGLPGAPGQLSVIAGAPPGTPGSPPSPTMARPATSVQLVFPYNVAVDRSGNIYLSDYGVDAVAEVGGPMAGSLAGQLWIIAGIATPTPNPPVRQPSTNPYPATSVQLLGPRGVAVDSFGNVYIADAYHNLVEEVTPGLPGAPGYLHIIAGNGGNSPIPTPNPQQATSVGFNAPDDVAVDSSGNVYIGDTNHNLVEEVQVTSASAATPLLATGADAGGSPQVNVYNAATGALVASFFAFTPTFTGGVRVALADINGDGTPDIICAAGPGVGPQVEVIDGTKLGQLQSNGQIASSALISSFLAFTPTFTGGVYVAAATLGGKPEIVVGAGAGGGPQVEVIDATKLATQSNGQIANSAVIASFFAFAPTFTGGVRVAIGDVNGDGILDIIAGAGPGGGPQVIVINGTKLGQVQSNGQIASTSLLASFFAFTPTFTGGVSVSVGPTTGSQVNVIVGAGAGGGPQVIVINGSLLTQLQYGGQIANSAVLNSFFAMPPSFTGGVRVGFSAAFGSNAGPAILTAAGPGGSPEAAIFDPLSQQTLSAFFALPSGFTGGVFIAG